MDWLIRLKQATGSDAYHTKRNGINDSPNVALSPYEAGLDIQKMPLSEFEKAGKVLKVWSEVLNEHVYFVSSDAVLNRNPLDAVAYTAKELEAMLDMVPEEVKAAHEVKRAFHKARLITHNKEVLKWKKHLTLLHHTDYVRNVPTR